MGINEAKEYLIIREEQRKQQVLSCINEEKRNTSQVLRLFNETYNNISFHDLKYFLLTLEKDGLIEKSKFHEKIHWKLK